MTDPLLDRLVAAVGTQYLVEAEIGRGGMAVVYRATDLRLHRHVAIKVLPPELAFNADVRERFLREAQTAAGLSHANVVPIYTVDERDGLVFIVMAIVDGESLGQRLERERLLPVEDARAILVRVADALAYAHERGVVHRDIKPDNIMLDRRTGQPMVTDFGIARAAQGDTRLTVTGVAIGTPAYMSPEQALGERELDGRSDIYALGIIAYQMLAGETPFKATNTPAMLVKHVSEAPRPLQGLRPDAPPALVHAVARALAKKPDDRWRDAAAFRDALQAHDLPPEVRSAAPSVVPSVMPPAPPAYRAMFDDPPGYPPRNAYPSLPSYPPPRAPQPGLPPMTGLPDRLPDRVQRKLARKLERQAERQAERALEDRSAEMDAVRPIDERVRRWQRATIGSVGTIAFLGFINAMTGGFPWFLFPAFGMGIGVLSRAGRLWSDGIPVSRLFRRGDAAAIAAASARAIGAVPDASRLAPADVLGGPHGDAVRRAAQDQAAVKETLARLEKAERDMIPDVAPTVDALAGRVGVLAATLHRLDLDVSGASVEGLDARLATLRAEMRAGATSEQERRVALLERQRVTIAELLGRRAMLLSQMESAVLALQNLRLDLLKLRSSGLGGAVSDVASATQEARALSREIGYAVDAAREVNRG